MKAASVISNRVWRSWAEGGRVIFQTIRSESTDNWIYVEYTQKALNYVIILFLTSLGCAVPSELRSEQHIVPNFDLFWKLHFVICCQFRMDIVGHMVLREVHFPQKYSGLGNKWTKYDCTSSHLEIYSKGWFLICNCNVTGFTI